MTSTRSAQTAGVAYAIGAYLLWGVLPLYFLLLAPTGPWELVAWRVALSFVFCLVLLAITRGWRPLRAIIRRHHDLAAPVVAVGDLTLDSTTGEFRLNDQALSLTPREHSVLTHLVMRRGSTVKKSALFDDVFGLEADTDPSVIEIYVHRVRKKLEGSNVQIATLRGLGYLLRVS